MSLDDYEVSATINTEYGDIEVSFVISSDATIKEIADEAKDEAIGSIKRGIVTSIDSFRVTNRAKKNKTEPIV